MTPARPQQGPDGFRDRGVTDRVRSVGHAHGPTGPRSTTRPWMRGLSGTALCKAALAVFVLTSLPACTALRPASDEARPAAANATSAASAANAADPKPAAADAADDALQSARRSVRSTAEWLARGVDSWFGDIPFSEGGKVTNGQLTLRLQQRQGESPEFDVRFNARFWLPNVENKGYLFIGRDDPRQYIVDRPDAVARRQPLARPSTLDGSFFAGFGARLRESVDLRIGIRGGLKPYAQARWEHEWTLGPGDTIDFRESLFWTPGERFGSTTALSYEHLFSPTLAGRWLNAATISQKSKNFEWSSSLGLYKSLGHQRLLTLEALALGVQNAPVTVSDYGLQVRWGQPLHKDWLLGELVVGHFWPRPDALRERRRAWGLGASLMLRF